MANKRTLAQLAHHMGKSLPHLRSRLTPGKIEALRTNPSYTIRPRETLRPVHPLKRRSIHHTFTLEIEPAEELLELAFSLSIPPSQLVKSWVYQLLGFLAPTPRWIRKMREEYERWYNLGILQADYSGHAPHPQMFSQSLAYRLRGASWHQITKLLSCELDFPLSRNTVRENFEFTLRKIEEFKLQPTDPAPPDLCSSVLPIRLRKSLAQKEEAQYPRGPKRSRKPKRQHIRRQALQNQRQQAQEVEDE